MTDDPAEKLLCKLLIHNKVLSKADIKSILGTRSSWGGKNLPDYLIESDKVKQAVVDKSVAFVEGKGQSFQPSQITEEEDDEPLELDVADDIAEAAHNGETLEEEEFAVQESEEASAENHVYEEPEVSEPEAVSEPANPSASESEEDDGESLIPTRACKPQNEGKKLIAHLIKAKENNCSDLHVTPGTPIFVRDKGDITRVDDIMMTPSSAKAMLFDVLTENQRKKCSEDLQLDFSLELEDGSRFRANICQQRTGWVGSFRIVAKEPPSFEELNLPEQVKLLTEYPTGLVLVTGPMGAGKTTTLAAMVDMINKSRKDHIITLEDPIEFRQYAKNCQVSQRSLGSHTLSYANALKGALRQDPDVILVGELRDLETISIAISAAETGHLVLGSLHTSSADRTIDRIVGVFPPDQQAQIRVMVAESFRGIVCQQLVPKADGSGRALALEILMSNTSVRKMIVDNRTFMLDSAMQTGKNQGMVRMDDSILELVKKKVVTKEVAKRFMRNTDALN